MKNKTIFARLKGRVQQLNINLTVLALTGLLFSSSTMAINLANTPLFLEQRVAPAVMFILDDSGSMDRDILTVPHWSSSYYDRDVLIRSYARGGQLLNGTVFNFNQDFRAASRGVITSGLTKSGSGSCTDRNTDGLCFNELDLNGDGDVSDTESKKEESVDTTYRLGLYHLTSNVKYMKHCKTVGDASVDGLTPAELDEVKNAFITQYSLAAYVVVNQYAEVVDPKPGYSNQAYKPRGHPLGETEINFIHPALAAYKDRCADGGGQWKFSDARLVLHGPDVFHPAGQPERWSSDDWTSAGSVNTSTGAHSQGVVGGYHEEYVIDPSSTGLNLDINGDGDYEDSQDYHYFEADSISPNLTYGYLQASKDNIYNRGGAPSELDRLGSVCAAKYKDYNALSACSTIATPANKLNYANEAVDARQPGSKQLLSIPTSIPRAIRSPTWSAQGDYSSTADLVFPNWMQGTRHAMSEHDPWPLVMDWRPRSAKFNVLYYNPDIVYTPWPEHLPADFNKARSNPQEMTVGVKDPATDGYDDIVDLSRAKTAAGSAITIDGRDGAGFVYEIWVDDAGSLPSKGGPRYSNGLACDINDGPSIKITQADIEASFGGASTGILDPSADPSDPNRYLQKDDFSCFSYINYNPNGNDGDGIVDLWDSHYRVEIRNNDVFVQKVRRTPHLRGEQLYTDSLYRYASGKAYGNHGDEVSSTELEAQRLPLSDTRVLGSWTKDQIYDASNHDLCLQVLGADEDDDTVCRPLSQIKQNVANWFQYSRKRSFVAKGAIAHLIATVNGVNFGLMGTSKAGAPINSDGNIANSQANLTDDSSDLFRDVYRSVSHPSDVSGNAELFSFGHRESLIKALYKHQWRRAGTPLRQALQRAGEYFAGKAPVPPAMAARGRKSPIMETCQKSFAIMLTDGHWSGSKPAIVSGGDGEGNTISLGDTDGDGHSLTLADVAKYYYDRDLRSDLDNGDNGKDKQSLTTIGVAFGVKGKLESEPSNTAAGNSSASNWGDPTAANSEQEKIDDLWHAAYNSQGLYLNASDPVQLLERLAAALAFTMQAEGSASSLTLNADTGGGGLRLYRTTFDSGRWSGDVLSLKRSVADGPFNDKDWSAQEELSSRSSSDRKIFTSKEELDPSGDLKDSGISFAFASLTDLQKGLMDKAPDNTALDVEEHINYIRGDLSNDGILFHDRDSNKLGSIVHSAPLLVGTPSQSYSDSLESKKYSDFVEQHTTIAPRAPMIYVGANDGMLHAFDAATGEEKYAYIPRTLIGKLKYRSFLATASTPYAHKYFVDDTPVVKDAFIKGDWRTVLVGGLRAGGRTIYALDVTTVPGAQDEQTIATNKYLWEFSDPGLQYTFSRPQIARMADGKWAAIFGNGYPAGWESTRASLYIVDLETGDLLKKLEVGTGGINKGLSSPTVVDLDEDSIADYVYAGDLSGNLWRFDVSSADSDDWKVSFNNDPLFVARVSDNTASDIQPITVAPTVQRHPRGRAAGVLVSFGTGKYLETGDNAVAGQNTQTLYGIWDPDHEGNIDRSKLLVQSVPFEATGGSRATSAKAVTWMSDGHQIGDQDWKTKINHAGWRLDLTYNGNNGGERIVNKTMLFGDVLIVDTLIPGVSSCDGGGSSRRLLLDPANGANYLGEPEDKNSNGIIDAADYQGFESDFINAVITDGLSFDEGNAPYEHSSGETRLVVDKSDLDFIEPPVPMQHKGQRRSWIQLD